MKCIQQLLVCWSSKRNKSSINVISQQTVTENVASVSNAIIKGDKNLKGNMWKIKGCRGGVGVVLEHVIMAWSVGPVPTKPLISLIKRTLVWYVMNSGESGHVPSLHSPPLSHTLPGAAINHNNMRNKREKVNSVQILKTLCFVIQQTGNCIWSKAEAQCKRCICYHWPLALLCVLLVWKEHSESLRQSILSAKVSHLWPLLERKPAFWSTTVHMNQTYVWGRTART